MERMKGMPSSHPDFTGLLMTLTGNFDEFPDVAVDGAHGGEGGGKVKRAGSKAKNEFVGYTFKRAKDGPGAVLSKSGSGSGLKRPSSGGGAAGVAGAMSPPTTGGAAGGLGSP